MTTRNEEPQNPQSQSSEVAVRRRWRARTWSPLMLIAVFVGASLHFKAFGEEEGGLRCFYIAPEFAVRVVNTQHEIEGVMVPRRDPIDGDALSIKFNVTEGPNAGFQQTFPLDPNGDFTAKITLTSAVAGFDRIQGAGCFTRLQDEIFDQCETDHAEVLWIDLFDVVRTTQRPFRFPLRRPVDSDVGVVDGARCFERAPSVVEVEPNDEPDGAQLIALGDELTGSLPNHPPVPDVGDQPDVDLVKFAATAGTDLRAVLVGEGLDSTRLELIDPEGVSLLVSEDDGIINVLSAELEKAGTYTLVLSGRPRTNSNRALYRLDLRDLRTQPAFIPFGTADTIQMAVDLSPGNGPKRIACDFSVDGEFQPLLTVSKTVEAAIEEPPPAQDDGCTRGEDYWKEHNRFARGRDRIAWPIDEKTELCGKSWLQHLLKPDFFSPFNNLADEWIAAKLNVANGAKPPAGVAKAIEAAGALLGQCKLHYTPRAKESLKKDALKLAFELGRFNHGFTAPGSCPVKKKW